MKTVAFLAVVGIVFVFQSFCYGQKNYDEFIELKIRRFYPYVQSSVSEWRVTLSSVTNDDVGLVDLAKIKDAEDQLLEIASESGESLPEEEQAAFEKQRRERGERVLLELLESLPKETILRIIQTSNIRYLKRYSEEKKLFDPSFLSVPLFQQTLKLSARQRDELKELARESKAATVEHLEAIVMEMKDSDLEKLRQFGRVLSDEQTQKVRNLIGSPVRWHKLLSSREDFRQRIAESYIMDPPGYRITVPQNGSISIEDVKNAESPKAIEEFGVEHLDLVVFTILSSEFFANEVELTEDQIKSLKRYLESTRKDGVITGKFTKPRLMSLIQGEAEFPKTVTDILLPQQLKWLRQTELQFRTGQHRSTFGLTHPRLAKQLEISNKQKLELDKIAREFEEKNADLEKSTTAELIKLGFDFGERRMKLLSKTDRERYQQITGMDCDDMQGRMELIASSEVSGKKH